MMNLSLGTTWMRVGLAVMLSSVSALALSREICIHSQTQISGGTVYLKDVADVRTDDDALTEKLKSSEVGFLNPETHNAVIGLYEINQLLTRLGLAPAGFQIYGARRCVVQGALALVEVEDVLGANDAGVEDVDEVVPDEEVDAAVVSASADSGPVGPRVAEMLEETFAQQSGMDLASLRFDWYGRQPDLLSRVVDANDISFRPLSSPTLGRVQYRITLEEGESSRDYVVSGDVALLCESVVATRLIRAGEKIQPSDIALQFQQVRRLGEQGLSRVTEVIGFEASRTIQPNQTIQRSMIRKVQLIQRDDMVDVTSRAGALVLQFRGKALEPGGQDDWISVRNERNDTVIQGRIVGPGAVEVMTNNQPVLAQQ